MASQHCREGKVFVDGKALKPAREVKVGEVVHVRKGAVTFGYEVVSFPRSRVGAALVPDHMRDVTAPEEMEKLEMIRLAQQDRPKGVGRPTKRDRGIGKSLSLVNAPGPKPFAWCAFQPGCSRASAQGPLAAQGQT